MIFTFTNDGKDKGYENATEILFTENYDRVYKKAASILADPELAKDATQETFFRAFLKMDTLTDKSKFSSWVCSITVNVCNRMLGQKVKYRINNLSIYDDDGNIRDNIPGLIDFNVPDNIYEDSEIRQELKRYISELDVESQQIINMKIYGDFSIEEISAYMDMKESTVKSKIHRAKQKVADKYRKFIDMKG
jgi:RNA polymerase sigma-70 factor (ECF subfamily)